MREFLWFFFSSCSSVFLFAQLLCSWSSLSLFHYLFFLSSFSFSLICSFPSYSRLSTSIDSCCGRFAGSCFLVYCLFSFWFSRVAFLVTTELHNFSSWGIFAKAISEASAPQFALFVELLWSPFLFCTYHIICRFYSGSNCNGNKKLHSHILSCSPQFHTSHRFYLFSYSTLLRGGNIGSCTGWHTKSGRKVNAYNSKTTMLRNVK